MLSIFGPFAACESVPLYSLLAGTRVHQGNICTSLGVRVGRDGKVAGQIELRWIAQRFLIN